MNAKPSTDAVTSGEQRLAKSIAIIVRSGIFETVRYSTAAGLPPDSDVQAAASDYLTRGEREGQSLHCLFLPHFVHRQLDELGIPLVGGSALLTYLAHPEAPLDPHPLFDHKYFVREDSSKTHLEDYLHRGRRGAKPPSPHVLFDAAFYCERYPRVGAVVAAGKMDPLMDYLLNGAKAGRQPHLLFDTIHWTRSLAASGIVPNAEDPLTHYCSDPSTWHASTHPLFDPVHLREHLTLAGMEPSSRYPPLADMLLRRPEVSGHRLFDPAFYRTQAKLRSINFAEHPLVHYAQGRSRGQLDPHPLFSEAFYLDRYRDIADGGLNPLEHYVRTGQSEGREPNPLFSPKHYRSCNPGIALGETGALEHYVLNGGALLDPHPLFDARTYAARHPECPRPGDTPLGHYSRTWAEHGLRFPPWGTALFPRRQAPRDCRPAEVILVSHDLTRTGAPLILLRIVQDLVARRGLRTLVLAVQGGELLEDFCEWSAVVDLSRARAAGVPESVFMASLRGALGERGRPQLVIVNTACVDPEAVTLGTDLPAITLVHELASSFSEARFVNIYAHAGLVIFPAEFVRNEAHVLYPLPVEKSMVLPQGLLNPEFGLGDAKLARASVLEEIGAEPNAFIVLGCGTMDLRKGLDTFVQVARTTLRAAGSAPDARPVHFVWIGGGRLVYHSVVWYVHQDIDRGGLSERVHLLGARLSTETYFLAADAFIMTSRMDPFPCVIHEAMACAKPIVAFADSGGAPEALRNEAGIVVPYGDSVAMAEEVLQLRRQPHRAAEYGARAREVVRTQYVFSDYVDRMLSLAQDRLGVKLPAPLPGSVARPERRRVVVACGDSELPFNWRQSEFLVAGLLDRGFDAELLFTGNPRNLPASDRARTVPLRVLTPSFGKPASHKQRWDAMMRVLEVGAPAVLIHNLDLIASAVAPLPCPGMGILGIVNSASQEPLEQAARLGRYWQRAVATSDSLAERVLDAAPFLRERLVVIPRPVRRYPAPQRRDPERPLGIVLSGQHPRRDSAMGFLGPLVRALEAARVPFKLTAVNAGPEAQLLKSTASTEAGAGRIRIADLLSPQETTELLTASDVLLMLDESDGAGIDLLEAMRAGLAVIAVTKSGDADNRLQDGAHGFWAPLATVQTCVDRLGRLARDRELLERMRKAAHETGRSAPDAAQVSDTYAALIGEMLEELRSRSYTKPEALYADPVLGALSLPPMFQMDPAQLGFAKNL